LQRGGQRGGGTERFPWAVLYEPPGLNALVGAGYTDFFLGRPADAETLLAKAVALYPSSAGALYRLAAGREAQARGAEAPDLLERAIGLRPDMATPHAPLGSLQPAAKPPPR